MADEIPVSLIELAAKWVEDIYKPMAASSSEDHLTKRTELFDTAYKALSKTVLDK